MLWYVLTYNSMYGITTAILLAIGLPKLIILLLSWILYTVYCILQWGDTEPIMGSKYHTLHHTHYHYNYGQWFIFCDYLWGTLRVPQKQKFD
jgi:sterol desaturase/sphingolipid hydroxylase (fatty acid hydroxylase superfamily)